MKSFEQFKKEALKNPKVAREYKRLGPRYKIISELIGLRIKKGLTQADVAKKMGTKQSAIARMESGDENLTIDSVQKMSEALGAKVRISIN
jgi:predicted transcriptional regulator